MCAVLTVKYGGGVVMVHCVRGKWQSRGKLQTAGLKIKPRRNWEEEELARGLSRRGRGHDPDNDLMARLPTRVTAPMNDGASAAVTGTHGVVKRWQ